MTVNSARICSFPPIATSDARILILGSMPGVKSLAAQQYYAHPQNTFWRIMAAILGFDIALSYAERVKRLSQAGIAVWDVLHSCERSGSLDSAILAATVNDFAGFFKNHLHIERICFNGATAESYFRKVALPQLRLETPSLIRLPSTSPAHAGISLAEKTAIWRSYLTLPET